MDALLWSGWAAASGPLEDHRHWESLEDTEQTSELQPLCRFLKNTRPAPGNWSS